MEQGGFEGGVVVSNWRVTGKAGWDEDTGEAVYYVTKGSTSLNAKDHIELAELLAKAPEIEPTEN